MATFASRRLAVGWTISAQRERPGDPRIAPTRPRTCRRPAPPPATATGRAPAGRPGAGGSGGRPTGSPGLADRRPVQERRGGGGPVLPHEIGGRPLSSLPEHDRGGRGTSLRNPI